MNTRNRAPLRGGNWNNGSNAGLGALNLNNDRSNSNSNIGSRSALYCARSNRPNGPCQCLIKKDAHTSAIAETTIKPIDASSGCTYESIIDYDNLLEAAYQCRKGKTKAFATLSFFNNLEENILNLHNELIWGTYETSEYRHFYVYEPKRRLISAPDFRDRVVHRAIYNVLDPLFDKRYIHDSYACRKGKGTHKGADRAQSFIRKARPKGGNVYALKADIYHYFSSIDHCILKSLVSSKIQCHQTNLLINYIIDSSPSDCLGVGIPLGNLTSQMFANIYLHELDIYVKRTLKVKHYVRYMDDFVVFSESKEYLHKLRNDIDDFIRTNLRLSTNNKTQVFPIGKKSGRALDFLGYRIYDNHRLLRRCSVKRMKTKMKKYREMYSSGEMETDEITQKIKSWLGHAKHANTHGLINSLLNKPFTRESQ